MERKHLRRLVALAGTLTMMLSVARAPVSAISANEIDNTTISTMGGGAFSEANDWGWRVYVADENTDSVVSPVKDYTKIVIKTLIDK